MHPTYKRMLAGLKKKKKPSRKASGDRQSVNACPLTPANAKKKSDKTWFLYILRCSDKTFYTGITNNLDRRLKMHQTGKASRYTRTRGPVEMLYSEICGNRSSALIRECEVKEWPKKKKISLIAGEKQIPKKRKRISKTSATPACRQGRHKAQRTTES